MHEELEIPVRPGDGRVRGGHGHQPALRSPGQDPLQRIAVDVGITDHTAACQSRLHFELRLDQGHDRSIRAQQSGDRGEHPGQRDERDVDGGKIHGAAELPGRQTADVALFEHDHAGVPPQRPGQLTGADVCGVDEVRSVL